MWDLSGQSHWVDVVVKLPRIKLHKEAVKVFTADLSH